MVDRYITIDSEASKINSVRATLEDARNIHTGSSNGTKYSRRQTWLSGQSRHVHVHEYVQRRREKAMSSLSGLGGDTF